MLTRGFYRHNSSFGFLFYLNQCSFLVIIVVCGKMVFIQLCQQPVILRAIDIAFGEQSAASIPLSVLW